jgi:hypothetical protein
MIQVRATAAELVSERRRVSGGFRLRHNVHREKTADATGAGAAERADRNNSVYVFVLY